jgi:hypothetical protein
VARNKKSVTCNLHLPEGQDLVRSLVADADVLLENFPPRDTRALGHVAGGALGNQPSELLHQVLLNLLPCGRWPTRFAGVRLLGRSGHFGLERTRMNVRGRRYGGQPGHN